MAWTAPRTWVVGEVVTAAIMNQHVRDNLLETAPAKVTTAGDLVYATGANALTRLGIAGAGALLKSTGSAPAWHGLGESGTYLRVNAAANDLEWGRFRIVFGNGSDGSVTLNGTTDVPWASRSGSVYTVTRDVQCTNLTINSGVTLRPSGWRIFCTGTLKIDGLVQHNGGNGAAGGFWSGGSGGSGAPYGYFLGGGAGGSTDSSGESINPGYGGNGGHGGGYTNGGTVTNPGNEWRHVETNLVLFCVRRGLNLAFLGGGAGGGGGRQHTDELGRVYYGGGGGGGGGLIVFCAPTIAGSGSIEAKGGNGGDATGTTATGGGGGGGGAILRVYTSSTFTGTTNVSGGSGGSGPGGNGTAGSNGQIVNIEI